MTNFPIIFNDNFKKDEKFFFGDQLDDFFEILKIFLMGEGHN